MIPCEVIAGNGPIILAQPHGGTFVPDEIIERLNTEGRALADTDWHITRLYDGICKNATTIKANFHRYVIDANRDPADVSLYPGQNTTSLCPLTNFDGLPIYHPSQEPTTAEIKKRKDKWHTPYHNALQNEINRVKSLHGLAVVFDCHSIRSHIPFLFDGILPTLNIGTDNGRSCAPELQSRVHEISAVSTFTTILNGRFRGGWTTRHYGQTQNGVHAIQMEIIQQTYLEHEQAPWNYDETKAAPLRMLLKYILDALADRVSNMKKEVNS